MAMYIAVHGRKKYYIGIHRDYLYLNHGYNTVYYFFNDDRLEAHLADMDLEISSRDDKTINDFLDMVEYILKEYKIIEER